MTLFIIIYDTIVYVENPIDFTKKKKKRLLEMSEFSKDVGY